jgi:hypothetical protein
MHHQVMHQGRLALRRQAPRLASRGIQPIAWLAIGVAIGIIAEALFDPRQGAGRRARLRDGARGRARRIAQDVRGVARDVDARARGALHELRARRREHGVPDDVLVERVRAQIGKPVSHAGALEIAAHEGRVEVHGVVLVDEAESLLATVRRVRGVRDVVDCLDRRDAAGVAADAGEAGRRTH